MRKKLSTGRKATVSVKKKPSKRRSYTRSKAHEIALKRFAEIVLRVVRVKLSEVEFTRDDILSLISQMRLSSKESWAKDAAGINDTATGTRYRKVCDAVQHLIATQQLSALDWLRLCLPEQYSTFAHTQPLHEIYLPTIRRLVGQLKNDTVLDVMSVVDLWRTDQHLPQNVKKMTVRAVLPKLAREKLLKRGTQRTEFVIRRQV
jgi:hypothetical protein